MTTVRPLSVPGGVVSKQALRDIQEGRDFLLASGMVDADFIAAREKHDNASPRKSSSGPFVAWDGEGVTENGRHRYTLLANSYGNYIRNPKGIATLQALHFLCDQAKIDPRANHVCYGASYDVNMILGDLGSHQVWTLCQDGVLHYGQFRIEYRPRRQLLVTRYREGERHTTPNKLGSMSLWDVIGFFQCRFTQALDSWLKDVDPETLAFIAEMKAKRSGFAHEDPKEVLRYCLKECELLVMLMTKLRNKMRPVGLIPTRWDGAGAIGGKLLQNHHVPTMMGEPPDPVREAAQYAYFGGRIEAVRYGNLEAEVFSHDIRSAYPTAMLELPCFAHGRWQHSASPVSLPLGPGEPRHIGRGGFRVSKVRFRFSEGLPPIHPLPWREENGSVFFPASGEGWYWEPEVQLLRDFRPGQYRIAEQWEWRPACDHQPFRFVTDVYTQRQRMRLAGHDGHIVLKLALNSLYGKLAQKVGWKRDTGKPPTYHQLEWAGWITSVTRAKLYRLAMQHPEAVIAFETDGLYSTAHHDCQEGEDLGEWEVDSHDGITYLQSGLYWLKDNGEWWSKSRGLMKDTTGHKATALTRDRVLAAWKRGSYEVKVVENRFRTMAAATASLGRFVEWRQWCDDKKTVTTIPRGKRMAYPEDIDTGSWSSPGLHPTLAAGGGGLSTPHYLPWVNRHAEPTEQEIEDRWERELADERLEGL
jgi:hypothetical protein